MLPTLVKGATECYSHIGRPSIAPEQLLRALCWRHPPLSNIAGPTVIYHGRVLHLLERARHEDDESVARGDPLRRRVVDHLIGTDSCPHRECAGLTSLTLPDIKIGEAVAVPAATSGEIRAAHCRVTGVIGTEIRFSLLLPDTWNGKFMMGGGGAFVGTLDNHARATVNGGYATVGTDTGHQGNLWDASWALNNLERQVNFGYVAVHRTAETAKAILRHYYGTTEKRSYFSGCSNGGRQGLMEAQRYPDDFDGIVAGAPALDFVGLAAQFVKDMQALFPDPRNLSSPMFTPETLKSVEAQIVEKCDAVDRVKDGLLDDPRRCKIDVTGLAGLSDGQRAALKTIYAETSGKEGAIYPAQPMGGEGKVAWRTWITGGGQGAMSSGSTDDARTSSAGR
jgi:Tannase and feruloyl esterase